MGEREVRTRCDGWVVTRRYVGGRKVSWNARREGTVSIRLVVRPDFGRWVTDEFRRIRADHGPLPLRARP